MSTFYGFELIDLVAIVGYFAAVMAVGFWASRRVKDESDFFLGGRSFGKGLLVMHWLCTVGRFPPSLGFSRRVDRTADVAGPAGRLGEITGLPQLPGSLPSAPSARLV